MAERKQNVPDEDWKRLLENNKAWAEKTEREHPGFFEELCKVQQPKYLWIGCSDSRVPANQILGLKPGEVFVHRNIANCVNHTDLNCLSVIQYAVDVLQVEHIIVCGHLFCGGVRTALTSTQFGLLDNWIRHIKDVARNHSDELNAIEDFQERAFRLVELNVKAQVKNVMSTAIVQNAWKRKQKLSLHGWVYSVQDGILRQLIGPLNSADHVSQVYRVDAQLFKPISSYAPPSQPGSEAASPAISAAVSPAQLGSPPALQLAQASPSASPQDTLASLPAATHDDTHTRLATVAENDTTAEAPAAATAATADSSTTSTVATTTAGNSSSARASVSSPGTHLHSRSPGQSTPSASYRRARSQSAVFASSVSSASTSPLSADLRELRDPLTGFTHPADTPAPVLDTAESIDLASISACLQQPHPHPHDPSPTWHKWKTHVAAAVIGGAAATAFITLLKPNTAKPNKL